MGWIYLFYFSLASLLFFRTSFAGKGAWNEEYTSLKQTRILQGISALGVVLHHMAQKTCASWVPSKYLTHGLEFFLPLGYLFVAVFLFCSGLGLYKSYREKPDYLKNFFSHRILPVIVAFYLSELLYTGIRLLVGEKMNFVRLLWYLSGLHMANTYAWYVIVIPFFYLVFWLAFRFSKRDRTAILWVFLFTLAYTVLGAITDHQDDWWMRGEWWYNSIILFPLGLLFGKTEKQVTSFFRKGYWFWLIFTLIAFLILYRESEYLVNRRWGYYGDWGDPLKVQHRLLSAGSQWLVCILYVTLWFLLMMKLQIGNKVLALIGSLSLDLYLMHGIFVECFGYRFFDMAKSVLYIRELPLYIAAVTACSFPAALLFRMLRKSGPALFMKVKGITGRMMQKARKILFPALFVLLIVAGVLATRKDPARVVGNLIVAAPEGYTQKYTDSRYTVWTYTGNEKKPGQLVLDTDIRGIYAQSFATAESVLNECTWLKDPELYVNPQGIRMVRGFSPDTSESPERRYYVENGSAVFLLCMIEDSRYYNPADCEEVMQKTADSIRPR